MVKIIKINEDYLVGSPCTNYKFLIAFGVTLGLPTP